MKKNTPRYLSELKPGESAKVFKTLSENERLAEIGLVKGESVTLIKVAPLGDPVMLQILEALVIVRRADLTGVLVI